MASLGAPGRFGSLVVTIEDDFLGDGFFDCPCDNPEFRFEVRGRRRCRQQERRRQQGQQRGGRTARKRAAVNATTTRCGNAAEVQGHRNKKRLCWLGAKLRRAVSLWHAEGVEARMCYEVHDSEWNQLEEQMTQAQSQSVRFWRGAVEKLQFGGVQYCFGEGTRT